MNRRDLFRGAGAAALAAAMPPEPAINQLARAFPPGSAHVTGDVLRIEPGQYIFHADGTLMGRVTGVTEKAYWK